MNAATMEDRVRFYLNQQKSPRIEQGFHINQALNIAQTKFIEDRVDNIKKAKQRGSSYYFEAVERVKSELYTIVVNTGFVPPVGNTVAIPTDFFYELNLQVILDGEMYWSTSKTYNEYQEISRNSFTAPNIEFPVHIRSNNGVVVDYGVVGLFSNSNLIYLKNPVTIDVTSTPAVDCELPVNAHEEICEIASHIIAGTDEDYKKNQQLKIQQQED